jgi:hypothetical protein
MSNANQRAIPWWAVSSKLECPMCRNLLDRPGVELRASSRLHSTLDGYALYRFRCPERDCGWDSGELLVEILPGRGVERSPALARPTHEEIAKYAPKPSEAEPVDVSELVAFLGTEFPETLGDGLERRLEAGKGNDSFGEAKVDYVKVSYGEAGSAGYVERRYFAENGLPDAQKEIAWLRQSLDAELKRELARKNPLRVATPPRRIGGVSERVAVKGDMRGGAGLPSRGFPTDLQAPESLLVAPDGSLIPTLQQRLEAEDPLMRR